MHEYPLLPVIRSIVRTLTRFTVEGAENVPEDGGLLMTSNHRSRLDTPLLMTATHRNDLVAIVAKKYQKKAIFKWILEKIGTMVWMDRDTTDFSAVRQSLEQLRMGKIVGIAPEGTRSRDSIGMLEGKQGAAVLAARASVPILPIGIVGSDKINHYWKRLKRPPITLRVGKPYTLPEIDMNDRQAWLKKYTDEIMCQIAALLPPEYRGFYADHPRLTALLSEPPED